MTFVLTLIYIAMSLLSPGAFPDWMRDFPVILTLGVLASLSTIVSAVQEKFAVVPEMYCVSGVLIAGTISIVATGWLGGAVSAFLGFVPIIFTFYFVSISCRTVWHLKCLTLVLFAVSLFIIVQGILSEMSGDFTSGYLLTEIVAGRPDIYRHRGLGVLADPNDLCLLLVTVLPLMWMFWKKRHAFNNLVFTIVPSLLLVVGIYFTHSRGGAIALLAVVFYGFKDRLGLVFSSIIGGLTTLGVFALNFTGGRGINDDDGGRIALWSQALDAFKAHPFFGVGMNKFSDYSDVGLTAHNSYVLCLAELGLFGYLFWMGTIVSGWNGLGGIVKASAPSEPEEGDGFEQNAPPYGVAMKKTGFGGEPFAISSPKAVSMATGATHADFPLMKEENDESNDEGLVTAVKCSRAAFVGLLVSAFFLSRTYSMVFYILFGMAAALQMIYRRGHPEVSISFGKFLRSVTSIIFLSILGLYLFVRFRSH